MTAPGTPVVIELGPPCQACAAAGRTTIRDTLCGCTGPVRMRIHRRGRYILAALCPVCDQPDTSGEEDA